MENKRFFVSSENGFTHLGYTIKKCYGYRNARLDKGVAFDRDMFKAIEEKIMDAKVGFGNHCVVVLKSDFMSNDLVLYFRDLQVLIGTVDNIVSTLGE